MKPESSGSYIADIRIASDAAANHSRDSDTATRLWHVSEDLVGEKFDI